MDHSHFVFSSKGRYRSNFHNLSITLSEMELICRNNTMLLFQKKEYFFMKNASRHIRFFGASHKPREIWLYSQISLHKPIDQSLSLKSIFYSRIMLVLVQFNLIIGDLFLQTNNSSPLCTLHKLYGGIILLWAARKWTVCLINSISETLRLFH